MTKGLSRSKTLPGIQAACSARSEFLMPMLFIAIGGICLWQSQDMSQLGAIFPVTIAIVTIFSGVLRLGQLIMRGVSSNTERDRGSTPRRVLLVLAMTVWALIMPWAGFLLAGLVSFVTLMMIAQYRPWTPRRLIGHLISGIVLVACFYGLFALLLNVPLPVGRWWM
ncbi:tripartite tricarboxylate transporter TctB family protein [Vreelandella arcis]|uniref:Tripartite tricarboxylate transporter TctB family protein n=1 Tax=Vreelandella arcis TaxID=416873 RepID=A0A1H0BI48_9GAMM|nr:tripartite tricarboxylate transporter TctB family protein [Halomonas arcis]SDN45329.1 Tripartite tricarboxylate transporter TctB family protein [Halomonas arcis]